MFVGPRSPRCSHRDLGSRLRPAHGLHWLRDRLRGRAAELERTSLTWVQWNGWLRPRRRPPNQRGTPDRGLAMVAL